MHADTWTIRARDEVKALSKDIFEDLDVTEGGIGWWAGHGLPVETRCGLSDYLIDAVDGIAGHLGLADYYLQEYKKARASGDFKLRNAQRRGGPAYADEESSLRLEALTYSFINAGSSVLDTLAAAVIGVAALGLPLVKADLRPFKPFSVDPKYPLTNRDFRKPTTLHLDSAGRDLQLGLVRTFRSCVLDAGPRGWDTWLDQKRNQLAHRGTRLRMEAHPRLGRGLDTGRFICLDRDPDLTTVQSFQDDSSTVEAMFLLEDAGTTMTGLLKSLNTAVIGTVIAVRSLWTTRREQPLLLPQPAGQWHVPQAASGFEGYEPVPDLFKTVKAVVLNPTDATRLNSSKALNKPT